MLLWIDIVCSSSCSVGLGRGRHGVMLGRHDVGRHGAGLLLLFAPKSYCKEFVVEFVAINDEMRCNVRLQTVGDHVHGRPMSAMGAALATAPDDLPILRMS